jgi:hypothetical protein
MRVLNASALALFVWLAGSSTVSADVLLTIRDGRVSLVATDATVRQILAEWARVGHTKIVNVERIPGGPVTLQLTNVSEQQALEILLRTAGGYVAAPRAVAASNLSRFDRIIVMPPSQPPRAAVGAPAGAFPPAFAQPPRADDDNDDDRSAPIAPAPPIPTRGQVFNVFPQPQVVNPQVPQGVTPQFPQGVTGGVPLQQPPPIAPPAGATPPTAPAGSTPSSPFGGVSVPGMIVPGPAQQQPGSPIPNRPEG